MAEKSKYRTESSVYWTNIAKNSADEDSDAFIPGLSSAGNRRPGRVKGRKTREVKAKVPIKQPLSILETVTNDTDGKDDNNVPNHGSTSRYKAKKPTHDPSVQKNVSMTTERVIPNVQSVNDSTVSSKAFQSFAESSIHRLKQASLKDLRPEDKQRVANLIKELARVGDEKEKVVQEMNGEREQYEKQLMTMVEQQERILAEREDIQEKLFQCQRLLTEYQAQLLNRQDRLNTTIAEIQEAPFIRQHLTERQPRTRIPVYKPASEIWANRNTEANDSVTDLLLNSKDPRDCVKRPFTSMIDKEIARERSLSRGSQGSSCSRSNRSRSGSPSEGRPKFAYPEKLVSLGPLHDPIASSTHKSVDIKAQISNFDQESVRSLTRGHEYENGGQLKEIGQNDSGKHGSKVAFTDKDEYNDEAEMHSPNLKSSSKLFNDPDYAKYYKKLSPGGRKRELLKQRQALLLEQERLREVLEKQERQLKERQSEYQKRQDLQKERMEFYQKDGKFPAFKLNFDDEGPGRESTNESEAERSHEEQEGKSDISDAEINDRGLKRGNHAPQDEEKASYEKYSPRGQVEIGTSPLATPTKVTKATSPPRSPSDSNPSSQRSQGSTSQRSTGSDGPRLVDVATSVSYRTPLKDASNRQGNLTLAVNRHKSSPPKKNSSQPESLSSARSVGEKTMNILEIVNSMEEETPTRVRGYYDEYENKPMGPASKNAKTKTGSQFSTLRQYTSPGQTRTRPGKLLEDPEESIEENKILEDIFFL
ncbi:protein hinderin-like isoform X2 [Dreissena polymorpha]|uniref:protein hinderin-like isoform X2 n=1 Tax=Dreissena polymorpha TaxID=45954 RepID=UPI002264AA23|nr:protein hinderin-like isoform X2 [Dreissena polymorpha]